MNLTTNYPSNLSPSLTKALKLVCEEGWIRRKAADECGVDAITVALLMKRHGLRKAPPRHIQKAIDMMETDGLGLREAAKSIKVRHRALSYWIESYKKPVETNKHVEAVVAAQAENMSAREAANKFGVQYGSVLRAADALGVKLPRKQSLRTRDMAREAAIALEYETCPSMRKVGAKFGVSRTAVYNVLKRLKQ